jgi:hypothetical protein
MTSASPSSVQGFYEQLARWKSWAENHRAHSPGSADGRRSRPPEPATEPGGLYAIMVGLRSVREWNYAIITQRGAPMSAAARRLLNCWPLLLQFACG